MTAPGTGSRARSRELGYAEAMREMTWALWAETRAWRDSERAAAANGDMDVAALLGRIRSHFGRYAEFAHAVGILYEMPLIGEFLTETYWHPLHEGPPVPRELPGREQAGSN